MPRTLSAPAGEDPLQPYLTGPLRGEFDAWLDATVGRWVPPLVFREVRKGVQALSALYVEGRSRGALSVRARAGQGKRAALETYYAPLHFLTVHHALARLGPHRLGSVRRVHDLGCGSGAAGAAVARTLEPRPELLALDRSGSALAEARRTFAAFGVPARTRRGALPRALPRVRRDDCLLLAWTVNELDADEARDALLAGLGERLAAGARLLVFEPLAGSASPWWDAWARALAPRGVASLQVKVRVALPEWVTRLDRAAGLDHRVLGARLLAGPLTTESAP